MSDSLKPCKPLQLPRTGSSFFSLHILLFVIHTLSAQPCKIGNCLADSTGNVHLVLENGAHLIRNQTDKIDIPLTLDLVYRNGSWGRQIWAFACVYRTDRTQSCFNRMVHDGRLDSIFHMGDSSILSVSININPHHQAIQKRYMANYRIALVIRNGNLEGRYKGRFIGDTRSGYAHGKIHDLCRPEHFRPLHTREHPRIILSQMEVLPVRARMNTPEGQAIVRRLDNLLKNEYDIGGRTPGYYAAGFGFKHIVTGDKRWADSAKSAAQRTMRMPIGSTMMIRRAPRWMGVAIAYDFCYNEWESSDPAFRSHLASWLDARLYEIYRGGGTGYNEAPHSNWMGIAYGSMGVIALSLAGDRYTPLPDALLWDSTRFSPAQFVSIARTGIERFLCTSIGSAGWYYEGHGYLAFSAITGVFPFVQAFRNVTGIDLARSTGLCNVLPLTVHGMVDKKFPKYGPYGDRVKAVERMMGKSEASCGFYTLGFAHTSGKYLPGVRHHFDRTLGLEGDSTFGIHSPHTAAYALVNYPFDTPARNPETFYPSYMFDRENGYFQFRPHNHKPADMLVTVYMRSRNLSGSHSAEPDMRVWGGGHRWIRLTMVRLQKNHSPGAIPLCFKTTEDGSSIATAVLTRNIPDSSPKRKPAKDCVQDLFRSVAVDFSGMSGTRGLFALADRLCDSIGYELYAETSNSLVMGERSFSIRNKDGSSLRGWFMAPDDVVLWATSKGFTAKGRGGFFIVMCLDTTETPVQITRKGFDGEFRIGKQTVRFEKNSLSLSHFQKAREIMVRADSGFCATISGLGDAIR